MRWYSPSHRVYAFSKFCYKFDDRVFVSFLYEVSSSAVSNYTNNVIVQLSRLIAFLWNQSLSLSLSLSLPPSLPPSLPLSLPPCPFSILLFYVTMSLSPLHFALLFFLPPSLFFTMHYLLFHYTLHIAADSCQVRSPTVQSVGCSW